jgi:uncharacterized protein
LPDGIWIARCIDPQGAMFALRSQRLGATLDDIPPVEIRWAAEWGGFTSRGRIVEKRSPVPATKQAAPSDKPPSKR